MKSVESKLVKIFETLLAGQLGSRQVGLQSVKIPIGSFLLEDTFPQPGEMLLESFPDVSNRLFQLDLRSNVVTKRKKSEIEKNLTFVAQWLVSLSLVEQETQQDSFFSERLHLGASDDSGPETVKLFVDRCEVSIHFRETPDDIPEILYPSFQVSFPYTWQFAHQAQKDQHETNQAGEIVVYIKKMSEDEPYILHVMFSEVSNPQLDPNDFLQVCQQSLVFQGELLSDQDSLMLSNSFLLPSSAVPYFTDELDQALNQELVEEIIAKSVDLLLGVVFLAKLLLEEALGLGSSSSHH